MNLLRQQQAEQLRNQREAERRRADDALRQERELREQAQRELMADQMLLLQLGEAKRNQERILKESEEEREGGTKGTSRKDD